MMTIDGSVLEGGGQLIRLGLSLSCIFQVPIKFHSIRAGRPKPGLAAQHLEGARLVSKISGGSLRSAELQSTAFEFITGPRCLAHSYFADSKTAGAVTLILQVALPTLMLAGVAGIPPEVSLIVKGGTNVPFSPSIDHTTHVLFPLLEKMSFKVSLSRLSRGFFPKGGGLVDIKIVPQLRSDLRGLVMTDQGQVLTVRGQVYGVGCFALADTQRLLATSAQSALKTLFNLDETNVSIEMDVLSAGRSSNDRDSTLGLEVWATTDTGCVLSGNVFRSSREKRGAGFDIDSMLTDLLDNFRGLLESGACMDEHTADQIVVYMALCPCASQVTCAPRTTSSSLHLETAVYVCNLFHGYERVGVTDHRLDDGKCCRLLTCAALE